MLEEVEIENDYNCDLLRIPGYAFEAENSLYKKRVGCYIKNNIVFERCSVLEEIGRNLVIIDVKSGMGKICLIILWTYL